ncbi:hypothetical protein ACX5I6_20325 [Arthrobacter sp. MMS24-T111]
MEKTRKTFRGMMIWGMSRIVAAPILASLLFVVISTSTSHEGGLMN